MCRSRAPNRCSWVFCFALFLSNFNCDVLQYTKLSRPLLVSFWAHVKYPHIISHRNNTSSKLQGGSHIALATRPQMFLSYMHYRTWGTSWSSYSGKTREAWRSWESGRSSRTSEARSSCKAEWSLWSWLTSESYPSSPSSRPRSTYTQKRTTTLQRTTKRARWLIILIIIIITQLNPQLNPWPSSSRSYSNREDLPSSHVQRLSVDESEFLKPVRQFLPERDYVTFGLLSQIRLSSVCLSVCRLSVTLVHSTQGVEPFGNISSPLYTLAILLPPCKILRRSSHGNSTVWDVKRKKGSKIERWWTYQRLYHINNPKQMYSFY